MNWYRSASVVPEMTPRPVDNGQRSIVGRNDKTAGHRIFTEDYREKPDDGASYREHRDVICAVSPASPLQNLHGILKQFP